MIVVDASVLASAFGDDEAYGDIARRELLRSGEVALPDLAYLETVSVLRKRWLAGSLDDQRFRVALGGLSELASDCYPSLPLLNRVYELRANLTPYDAVYVALAERVGCSLLTLDTRLARAPGPRCVIRVLTV